MVSLYISRVTLEVGNLQEVMDKIREPLERIRDADIILVNKGDLDTDMKGYAGKIPRYNMRYKRHTFTA